VFTRPRPGRPDADLTPFFALSVPFIAYLVVHSLHDRVQAHWPAPLFPMLSICAAVGARRLDGKSVWRRLAWAAPGLGFALGALALLALLAPGGAMGRYDLALPVRGWRPFAGRLDTLRKAGGAAWVGTTSYGLAAELADEPALNVPIVQLAERDRWNDLAGRAGADLTRPGLAIDLTRRVSADGLSRCFTTVRPLGVIARGDLGEPGKPYAAFIVYGPRRDILSKGC
jgi:hypothetical protein